MRLSERQMYLTILYEHPVRTCVDNRIRPVLKLDRGVLARHSAV